MNLEAGTLTKTMLVSFILLVMGGCKTDYNNGYNLDIRPPLMNNNSFTNFVPMNMSTNNTNNVEVPL